MGLLSNLIIYFKFFQRKYYFFKNYLNRRLQYFFLHNLKEFQNNILQLCSKKCNQYIYLFEIKFKKI